MNTSTNPLKFGYRILYYIVMFGIFFQFFAYPVYAMVEHFPYGAKSKYYIHYERPDDYLNSEVAGKTESKEVSTGNAIQKANQISKSYRLPSPSLETNTEETAIEIFSQDKSGTIGYTNNSNSDDPSDNIFSFNIEKQILAGKEIRLSYEVYGIENVSGISRSINQNNATGGYLVKKNSKWNHLEETISVDQLKDGVNHLMFTAFENKTADYKVKNVSIKVIPMAQQQLVALADGAVVYTKNNKAYLKGSVLADGLDLYIHNANVIVNNNQFETVVAHDEETTEINVQLKKQGLVVYTEQVHLSNANDATTHTFKKAEGSNIIKELDDKSYGFLLEDVGFNIRKGSFDRADQITVQKLRPIDLAPLGTNVINVTQNKTGFRFLPEGAKFIDQAQISVKFDRTLLPKGYDENDVKILYFDMDQRRWLSVPTDTIVMDESKVVGLTDHFTDYIAGVIQAPESPETSSFTPTSISDIQVANPTANIVQIQPPTANQKGDGTLDFPITIPAGRNGLQPNLSVSYNNNGNSGIVGYGWDIAIPYISVDTKFGVPQYHPTQETESYLLNGEELIMQNGPEGLYLPYRQSNTVPRNLTGKRVFFPKVEGSFSRIERHGNTPSTYSWIVWDKSGTKYEYINMLHSTNGGKWYLNKITDKNENFIAFAYHVKPYSQGNLIDGKEVIISQIHYTLHNDFKVDDDEVRRSYRIIFNYDQNSRNDAHFNYRYGFKEVNASKLNSIKVTCDKYIDDIDKYNLCNYHVEYHFNYGNGQFGKTLLNSITTKNLQKEDYNNDPAGITTASEEYTHTFDYYNDIAGGMFDSPKPISVADDVADEKHSVLSSTKESIKSTEFNLGAGLSPIGNPPAWWPFSYGGTINFNFPSAVSTSSSPTMLLLDIDGDGLDDKVVKIGNQIKYRKNLGGIAFSSQLYNAYNITDLGLYENETKTDPEMSVSIIAGSFTASKSQSNGRARMFFADVNSDGLIDFVKDRIVYFNRIDPNSDLPSFTDNSALTPNRIFKEGDPDPTVSAPLPDLTVGNDLMDVVKVWVAPKDGNIDISGTIYKNFVASHNGIRYSVEHSGRTGLIFPYWDPSRPIKVIDTELISQVPWSPSNPIFQAPLITPYNRNYLIQPTLLVTATKSTDKQNVNVKRGDRIYFRVNTSQIPTELVDVKWDPVVKYNDPQNKSSKYSDSFIHGDVLAHPLTIAEPGIYTIGWSGQNVSLNENVDIKIRAYRIDQGSSAQDRKEPVANQTGNPYGSVEIYKTTLNGSSGNLPAVALTINGSGINTKDPDTYIYVEVEAGAKFSLNWKKFDQAFIPVLKKTGVADRYIIPHYDMRENALTAYPGLSFPFPWPVKIKHNFKLAQCQNFAGACAEQYVYMIARYEDGEPLRTVNGKQAKFRYRISPEGMVDEVRQFEGEDFDHSPVIGDLFSDMDVQPNRELYVEYTTDEYLMASILNHYQNNNDDLISTTAMGFASGGASSPLTGASPTGGAAPMGGTLPSGLVRANIATKTPLELGMGTLYGHWGQFAYKGSAPNENFTPIDERYTSRLAVMGVSDLENPSQKEKDLMTDLMNKDLEDLDYDYDEGTITSGGSPISLNPQQVEAIRHFTMLRPDRANNAWTSHERLWVEEEGMSPYLRYYNEGYTPMLPIPAPTGIGQYGAVSIVKENTSESKSKGRNINFYGISLGTTDSHSTSRQLNDFMDVNGDGYPDILGDKIQLTTYRGGLSNTILTKNLLGNTISNGSGDAAGGSSAHITALADPSGRFSRVRVGGSATFDPGISLGTNKFETFTRPESVLVDINGDGLVDLIQNNDTVEFSTASAFVASTWSGYSEPGLSKTTSKGRSAGFGLNVTEFVDPIVIGENFDGASSSNMDLAIGNSSSRSVTHSEKDFVDFNGDGLPDYISGDGNGNGSIHFNTGTYHLGGGYSLPRLSESSTSSHGFNVNASILIPISIPVLGIVIKVGGGGGKSWGTNYNEDNISLRDFDGDGYVDIVESASETEVKVQFSKIRRTNMLKKISNPTGSTIELDYATNNVITGQGFGPTYKMPFKKWVLSKVKVNDGFTGDGSDVQQYAFEYQNGFKDRRERKFLGFGEVKTHQLKADGKTPYRTVEKKYMLDEMPDWEIYLHGDHSDSRKYQYIAHLPIEEKVYDGMQRLLSKTEYQYKIYSIGVTGYDYYQNDYTEPVFSYTDTSRIVPLLKRQTNTVRHYSGTGSSPYMEDVTSANLREYNKYGNITRYVDEVDNNSVLIGYHEVVNSNQYNVNTPLFHEVNNGERYSTTAVDLKGNITAISRYKDWPTNADAATTNLEYNSLGQLTKVILPKPETSSGANERMFYEYTYEDTFKLFVTEVTDAHGFTSRTSYDHFGMPLSQLDLNGVGVDYQYDPLRRPLQIKGPYNEEWTIRNEYKVGANGLYYTVTQHNIMDEIVTSDKQILHTSSFADGLGRIIQTKKQLAIEDDPNCTTPGNGYRFATSGLQVYDEFGRVTESYLGQEEIDCLGNFNDVLEKYTPLTHVKQEQTSMVYDMQDRLIQSHVHGLNATTKYAYGYENDGWNVPRAFEKVTLPEGNISITYKDEKGRVSTTKQIGDNKELVTTYNYDPLSQLTRVTDADNKETLYTYDNFGQKLSVAHPDNGLTKFTYDLTGKLKTSATQKLLLQAKEIAYAYHFNQLTGITYPSYSDNGQNYPQHTVNYTYGANAAPDYAAGRITEITDLTGTKTMKYGMLGEVVEDTRRLISENTGAMYFTTAYRYDSWGRMMEMTYPDGEHLVYSYNSVGQLKSIQSDDPDNPQWYLKDVNYNFFEQPTKITYGNDVVTTNEYDITQRIRAMQLDRPDTSTFMRNIYTYDKNQNITNITNNLSQHNILQLGGTFSKDYSYDGFNRLKNASGNWDGFNETHNYTLNMKYNNTHGIVEKNQTHNTVNSVFSGATENAYQAAYSYNNTAHPHAVSSISYSGMAGTQNVGYTFTYDANGNMATYNTNQENSFASRKMIWDQQNRLLAVVDDNTNVSHYVYDHAGERTFKAVGTVSTVNIGGAEIYSVLDFDQYTLYPSGYMVVDPGKDEYSKHYYINSKRFVSRLGNDVSQFLNEAGRSAFGANESTSTQTDGLDLGSMVGAQNTTYGISTPGNSEDDCKAQLNELILEYENMSNPPTASMEHCVDHLKDLRDDPDLSFCEALVEANKYVCTPIDEDDPGNTPVDPNDPVLTPGQMEQADCLTELNILVAQLAAQIQNGEGSVFFQWYQCIDQCVDRRGNWDGRGCWEAFTITGEWPEGCDTVYADCNCGNQPVITQIDKCPVLAMIYIDRNLLADLSNACAVLNYVKQTYKCLPLPLEPDPLPPIIGEEDDDWKDEGGNEGEPEEDYNEYERKPIWWYHTDHLGSSTYLTDNFGRPSHYYETLPFGEMMVEHNQSKYYKVPYPTTNTGSYDNKFKFNGKELDDATGMYYYGARYYDPRISIFVSVDPLAEETMTPYQYVTNNPIMFTDPTGMEQDGGGGGFWNSLKSFFGIGSEKPSQGNVDDDFTLLDELIIDKPKNRGDKVFNLKVEGRDKSIYENDKGIVAGAYRLGKQFRKWTDSVLSGGYHFDNDDNTPSGDQTLRKNPPSGQNVQRVNVAGLMQGGSFAKSWDGTGFKYGANNDETAKITNAVLTGFNLGQSIPESKVDIKLTKVNWGRGPDAFGKPRPKLMGATIIDTTVNLKDLPIARFKEQQAIGRGYRNAMIKYHNK